MNREKLLGRCMWSAKEQKDSIASLTGSDDCWFDECATLGQLVNTLPPDRIEDYHYFFCEQWRRVGEEIKLVVIQEYFRA